MTENEKPVEQELVACEVCLKEIPSSEAKSAEATEYIHYFCGTECYDKWKEKSRQQED